MKNYANVFKEITRSVIGEAELSDTDNESYVDDQNEKPQSIQTSALSDIPIKKSKPQYKYNKQGSEQSMISDKSNT
jgi:hypothetical protein